MGNILVADDERVLVLALKSLLEKEGHLVETAVDGEEALQFLQTHPVDVLLTDLRMPKMDGMALLKEIRASGIRTEVVLMTAHGTEKIAVQAMKEGAHDYLVKPLENDEVRVVIHKALEANSLRKENVLLRERLEEQYKFRNIIGRSPAMNKLFDIIRKVSPTDASLLITGESGTGKELVANAVHYGSPRKSGLFVAVNCAALSKELVESELFGHEKGAFTGAVSARAGKFELAHNGTLFLDEVGDMHPETQAKVLRALQEKTFERVGGSQTIRVDARILAATNRDLPEEIREGRFREDLYYRLRVIEAHIPPCARGRRISCCSSTTSCRPVPIRPESPPRPVRGKHSEGFWNTHGRAMSVNCGTLWNSG